MRFLTILGLLGCLGAAPAVVSHSCSGSPSGGATPTSITLATMGANLLVVVTSDYQGSGDTVTDSLANTWVNLIKRNTGDESLAIWYVASPTVGAAQTFTITGNYNAACVFAWSGVVSVGPADGSNSNYNSSIASLDAMPVSPTVDGDLFISATGFAVNGSADSAAVDSGFTILDSIQGANGRNVPCFVAWKVQGAAATIDPIWSGASTVARTTIIGAFKAAPATSISAVRHRVSQR